MITTTNIKNSFHQISSFIITDASLKYVGNSNFISSANAPELKKS